MKFWWKKTTVPVSNETKEIETVQLWVVSWWARYGEYSGNVDKQFEAFTSEKAANEFADSLKAAYKLLRHTSGTRVVVEKQK